MVPRAQSYQALSLGSEAQTRAGAEQEPVTELHHEETPAALEQTAPEPEEEPPVQPVATSSSSSLDSAVAGTASVPLDDFRAHQELFKQVASNLGLKTEEFK